MLRGGVRGRIVQILVGRLAIICYAVISEIAELVAIDSVAQVGRPSNFQMALAGLVLH